jgi:hypothetical protein
MMVSTMGRRLQGASATLEKIIEEERAEWHFDPMLKTNDYWYVENIKERIGGHWDAVVRFAREMDERVERISIVDVLSPQNVDEEISRNAALMASIGYDKDNTSQFKTYSDAYPEIFGPILAACDLANPVGSLLHQKPGSIVPWHYDTLAFYIRKFDIENPKSVRRYLIFLEDWVWGHYLLIGNSVVHQWHAGDVISWPYRMRHLSANAGLTPKLTLQVTGQIKAA